MNNKKEIIENASKKFIDIIFNQGKFNFEDIDEKMSDALEDNKNTEEEQI